MGATLKQHTQLVSDALLLNRHVHLFCRLDNSLPDIASIVASLIEYYEGVPDSEHPEWRGFIVAPTWNLGDEMLEYTKRKMRDKSGNFSHGIYGHHGNVRVLPAEPERLMGIMGHNLFHVVLRNQHPDTWEALWASVVSDTRILAVNSELFDERKHFTYLDWSE